MSLPTFLVHLADLAAQAGTHGDAAGAPGFAARTWQIPSTHPTDGTDVQAPVFFMTACDRSGLNQAAVSVYNAAGDPDSSASFGRLGQLMAAKTAIEHVATYERALHARYAGGVRLRAWAGARRHGHQDTTMGIFGCLGRHVQSLEDAATAVPLDQKPDG